MKPCIELRHWINRLDVTTPYILRVFPQVVSFLIHNGKTTSLTVVLALFLLIKSLNMVDVIFHMTLHFILPTFLKRKSD